VLMFNEFLFNMVCNVFGVVVVEGSVNGEVLFVD